MGRIVDTLYLQEWWAKHKSEAGGGTLPDNVVTQDMTGAEQGTANPVNADTLGGYSLSSIFNLIYPIGAIYMSMNATEPSTLFGGVWERIKGRFLFGVDEDNESYVVGNEGGEETHLLTVEEMPSHNHSWKGYTNVATSGSYKVAIFGVDSAQEEIDAGKGIQPVGGSQPHNNMPPYKCTYIWQRVS